MIVSVIKVTWTIQDAKGKKGFTSCHFPITAVNNLGYGVLDDFVRTTATLIDNLLLGRVIGAKTNIIHDLSGESIKAAPLPNSDVEEGAIFTFATDSGNVYRPRLPSFDEAFYVSGGEIVDSSNPDVDAYVQRIIQGRTLGLVNVSPSDDHGEDITHGGVGFEQFRHYHPRGYD